MQVDAVAVRVLGQVSGQFVPFSGPAVEALLTDILDVQDEQLTLLREIEQTVARLADGPWKAGRLRLQEAALPGRTQDGYQRLLVGASEAFRDAIPLQPDGSFSRAQVSLDLSMTLGFLRDQEAMRHYAQLGYLSARKAMWVETDKIAHKTKGSISRANRDRLAIPSTWFEDFEYAAAALGDPEAKPSYPAEPANESVSWRRGALLDMYYLVRQRQRDPHKRWRTDWERDPRWGGAYHPPGPPPWEEFWRKDVAIVCTPDKPTLRSLGDIEASHDYEEQANSGMWD